MPDICCSGVPRGIINAILVKQFSLDDAISLTGGDNLTQTVIDNWYRLSEVAWYMACQRYRTQLQLTQDPVLLSAKTRSFMMINIVPACSWGNESVDSQQLWQRAYAELCPLLILLPAGVVKRIPLLFPQQVIDSSSANSSEFDPLLFIMAIQHARKYPDRI
ncbi:hypothetical protein N5923_09155 [Erwiniaceae bacterium BAC15a-03b]|uniref:Uncharacterized protein n=1 Tax=Winslowiella arboricola TaxID=2978220 RepID=A0A9J6PMK9_9GAMM|nr:hypothetical protein [Winslowiella arboricola]MCU5777659.1 hypothetical protein [Winslowiella arboricola]